MVPALLLVVAFISATRKKTRIKNHLRIFKANSSLRGNQIRMLGPQQLKIKHKEPEGEKVVFEEDLRRVRSLRKKWPCPDCHRSADPQVPDEHFTRLLFLGSRP